MILGESIIRDYVDSGTIGIDPEPTDEQFQPASLDIRIGEEYYDMARDISYKADEQVPLLPDTPYIGHTVERVELPRHIGALLTGRSSVGRAGVIIHKTAGWIDPGFEGQITLEMFNFSETTHAFDVGDRVGQLMFFEVEGGTEYNGQYQDQEGVTKGGEI